MTLSIENDVHHEADDFDLPPDIVPMLWRMEERHFWHRARNAWISRALADAGQPPPARVLEIGCGSGAVAAHLHRAGYAVTGIDTNEPLVRKAHERCPEGDFVVGDVTKWRAPHPFDVIGFFDVLEHLSSPEAMLAAALVHARPGALLVATVPARQFLRTVTDDLSGHKRRYEVGQLAALLSGAGLVDVKERGIFRLTTPFQRILRRNTARRDVASFTEDERRALWTKNFRIPTAPVNFVLECLCTLERAAGFGLARGAPGASLLATARVPEVHNP